MQPTRLGGAPNLQAQPASPPAAVVESMMPDFLTPKTEQSVMVAPTMSTSITLPPNFPVTFPEQKMRQIEGDVKKFDFDKISMRDIAMIGTEVEQELHKTLGVFLAKINQGDQPKLFKLVEKLKDEVDKENLGELADKILNAQPGMIDKLKGMFSAKSLSKASNNAFENVRLLAAGKTKTLTEVIAKMEQELAVEMNRLEGEVKNMEALKNAYVDRFMDYAYLTVYMIGIHEKAQQYVAAVEAQGQVDPTFLNDLRAKFQALESRALTVEGMMTKLPSDQLAIRQIQNAGVQTLMETATTSSTRFASIKMTLIKINGALIVQGVQRLSAQGKALDETLQTVDRKLMNEVVTVAANAPGDNRLAQAQQLQQVIADTKALQVIVEQARVKNSAQFQQAREIFSQARADMQQLGTTIRPDQPLGY